MSKEVMIRVDNVSKTFKLPHEKNSSLKSVFLNPFKRRTYEKQVALSNVSFEVKRGEFFGIIGRNGSGKSTILKMLAGIYSPNEGSIQVNGKLTPFIELGVGFNQELTGRENVYLNGALLGFNRREVSAMYEDIVAFAELEKFMDQKLKNYSSGMQVRLAFSIAIKADSEILVLDEVLAVGDMSFQEKCFEYFEEIKAKGKTIVFVSHDQKSIERFCDRLLYIKDSKMEKIGNTKDVLNAYLFNMQSSDNQKHQADPTKGFHVGSGDALVGQAAFSKQSYSAEEDLKFSFAFDVSDKTIKKVAILFSIFDTNGTKVISGSETVSVTGGQNKHSVVLPAPGIAPGIYKANVGVFDADLKTAYDQFRNCAKFTIAGDNLRGGVLDQKMVWKKQK